MRTKSVSEFKLIITIALKKEVPKEWFVNHGVAVHTMEALRAGVPARSTVPAGGMMVIITGAGPKAASDAARWIRGNLDPLFVLNLGTCGVVQGDLPLGEWMRPRFAVNEAGRKIELDSRYPIPHRDDGIDVDSVLSVQEAKHGNMPDSWKRHNLVDMECFAQADVLKDTDISFHCLKFGADYSDGKAIENFNDNLKRFVEAAKDLFSFIYGNGEDVKISVVIPVFNRAHTITRAIDSVLAQSYQPDEVIVVDDGSTDRTRAAIKDYGRQIKALSLSENAGPSRARNEGVYYAKNELIAFLDSDDEWEPDKLKRDVDYLRTYPFYEIMQSDEKWIRNDIRVNQCKQHEKKAGWLFDQSLERCMISPSSVLVKRSLLERYGKFDEDLPVCEDYDLWLKISRHHPVGLAPGMSVIKYGGHEDQLSRKFPAMDSFRIMSLYRLLTRERLPNFKDKIISVLGKKLKILAQGYEKRGKRQEAQECREMMATICNRHGTMSGDSAAGAVEDETAQRLQET